MGLVHRRAEQIDGLTLLCPLVEPDESKRHMPASEVRKIDASFFNGLDKTVQEGLKSGEMGVVVLRESLLHRGEKIHPPAFRAANEEFLNRLRSTGYEFSFDIYRSSQPYEKPALLLTGLQDSSVGYRDTMKLHNQFKRATFVALDAAGHGLPLDQEDVFAALVREWIERVDHFEFDSNVNKTSSAKH